MSSGQPIRTHADANKFRNEYLETLALQESINDMNLQANKTYLLTGQLPPQSQLQDTRTSAEKLADVEKLKQDIADNLRPIAEPSFAYQIVNKISSSPLNYNNSLLRFLAQRTPSIAEQLNKIYPYGIAGDDNDLERIVEFIKNMYSEQQNKFLSTKTYMNSLSSNYSSSRIISANDIDSIITQLQDIMKNLDIIIQKGVNVRGIPGTAGIARRLGQFLGNLKNVLPTTNQLKLLLDDIENPNFNNPYENPLVPGGLEPGLPNQTPYSREELETFFKIMEKLPKYTEVISLINKIKRDIDLNNLSFIPDGLYRLEQMFIGLYSVNLNDFRNIKERQLYKEIQSHKLASEQTSQFIQNQRQEARDISKANKVYIINPPLDPVNVNNLGNDAVNIPAGVVNQMLPQAPLPLPQEQIEQQAPQPGPVSRMPYLAQQLNNLTLDDIRDLARQIVGNPLFDTPSLIRQYGYGDAIERLKDLLTGIVYPLPLLKPSLMQILSPNKSYDPSTIPPTNPLGVQGLGIKRGRGRPRGCGLVKAVEPKPVNFVGFGINEINQKQLNKGIVKIRRNTKTNYMDMPSRRVSSNLQNILKTIVGGGVPKYDELGKLDDEEKNYLHKLISKSNLTDRLSVPAPSKDQQEKDIHNFEILKGQILSGNDSKELVKDFKLLVRKLSKQGLLPKADVDDILQTLLELGY